MKILKIFLAGFGYLFLFSCKKYLEVGPPATQLVSSSVFSSDATATAAQLSIYAQMEATGLQHQIMISTAIASDEGLNYASSVDATSIAANNIVPTNGTVNALWTNLYKYTYYSNAVLEGLGKSHNLSEGVRKQLRGEALFVRSLCHFYLCNLFGSVPYITTTAFAENVHVSRDSVNEVVKKMVNDLKEAKALLADGYLNANNQPATERVRPTKYAAAALLARIYLLNKQWPEAEAEADFVISNNSTYSLLTTPAGVFLKNSREAILQWMATLPRYNSYTGGTLVASTRPTSMTLRPALVDIFESSDLRKVNWIKSTVSGNNTYYFPYKYQVGQNAPAVTEYTMVFRLAELYLIRAEARAYLGNMAEGKTDIDIIRNRAGLAPCTANSTDELLNAIRQERRRELFAEFGDRWLDIKRANIADVIMSAIKPASWLPTDALFPIPQVEIDRNPLLVQNPGY